MPNKFCIDCGEKFEYSRKIPTNTCKECSSSVASEDPVFTKLPVKELCFDNEKRGSSELDLDELKQSFALDNQVTKQSAEHHRLKKLKANDVLGSHPDPNFERTFRQSSSNLSGMDLLKKAGESNKIDI